MGNLDMVFNDQILIKVKPDDNMEAIENAKKRFLESKKKIDAIQKKCIQEKKYTVEDANNAAQAYSELTAAFAEAKINAKNYDGMDHFWTLRLNSKGYTLTTIPNKLNDEYIQKKYYNLDDVSKYYRSLSDIMKEENFVGKAQSFDDAPNMFMYVLYDYEEGFIGYLVDYDINIKATVVAVKTECGRFDFDGDNIPELDEPRLVYKYINKLKNNG